MIFLRLAIIPLGLAFMAVLFVALAFLRLDGGLLNPDYYPSLLKKTDVYRFVTVDVLSSAVDEARRLEPEEFGGDFHQNPLAASGLTTPQITAAVGRALSPQDLERLVAPAVLEIGDYVAARSNEVTLTVDAAGHVRGVVDEIEQLLRESRAYDGLLEQEVYPRILDSVREARADVEDPSGWTLFLFGTDEKAEDRLARAVQGAVTPEWSADQVEQALDEVTPYLLGESDAFEVRVRLTDIQTAAAAETASILREADAHDIAFTGVVEPELEERLGTTVTLPYGIEVAREEIVDALRQAVAPALVQQQVEPFIVEVSDYLTARSEGFSAELSLTRSKTLAATALTNLAVAKLDQALRSLPACATEAEARTARSIQGQELPACLPSDVPASEIVSLATPGIADAVRFQALGPVPDTVAFTESDFRAALSRAGGQEALDSFDDVREIFREDWTYNQDDLRDDLSGDALSAIDETRSFLADGYVHPQDDPGDFGVALDDARQLFGESTRYAWVVYVLAAVLLGIIGLLGGRSWSGRAAWAALVLLISASVICILSWPVYEAQAGAAFEQARADILDETGGSFPETSRLVAGKLVDIMETAALDLVTGIRWSSFTVALSAFGALLTSVFWHWIARAFRSFRQ